MSLHLKDVLGSLVEDDAPKPHAATPITPAPVVPAPSTYISPTQPVDTADHSDDSYQRLLAKTNWEKAPVFVAIQKYLGPMDGLAVDEKTKFSIALKQAQAQDGIDPASLNENFETLKTVLQQASDTFTQNVAAKTASDVDAKKQQAESLQAQVQQLTEDAFAAQQK